MTSEQNNATSYHQLLTLAQRQAQGGAAGKAAGLYRLAADLALAAHDSSQALDLVNRALALAPDQFARERFDLLLTRERIHTALGKVEARQRDLAALETLASQLDDDGRRAFVAARQADFRATGGDFAAAASLAALALRLAQLAGALQAEAAAHLTLGRAQHNQARYDQAQRHMERALQLATETNDRSLQADALRWLGALSTDRGEIATAREHYHRATEQYTALGDRVGLAQTRNNLAHVYAHEGNLARAAQEWRLTHELFEALDDLEGSMRVLINLGAIHVNLGQYDAARSHLSAALSRSQEVKLHPGVCFALLNLGLAAHQQGRHEEAVDRLRQALALAEEMGARRLEAAILTTLGHALHGDGKTAQAGDTYWEAVALWDELGLPNPATDAQAGLARIALENGTPSLGMFFVEPILARMTTDPGLDGAESPVRVILTCYQVLEAMSDRRAPEILAAGRELLEERAAGVGDEAARDAVLRNVPAHREILAIVARA